MLLGINLSITVIICTGVYCESLLKCSWSTETKQKKMMYYKSKVDLPRDGIRSNSIFKPFLWYNGWVHSSTRETTGYGQGPCFTVF